MPDRPADSAAAFPAPHFGRRLRSALWTVLAATTVTIALTLFGLRILIPNLHQYTELVEQTIASALKRPVEIGSLNAEWDGWRIRWNLHGLTLKDQTSTTEIARLNQARLILDPLDILLNGRLEPHAVVLTGVELSVERTPSGAVRVVGFHSAPKPNLGSSGQNELATGSQLTEWVLSQPGIELREATVHWLDKKRNRAPFTATNLLVKVVNTGGEHRLAGSFELPGPHPADSKILFAATLDRAPSSPDWSGKAYVKAHRVAINALPIAGTAIGMRPAGGSGDFELWADLNNGSVAAMSGTFSVRDFLLSGRHGDVLLPSATGMARLRRDEDTWLLQLSDLDLVTESGAWPKTNMRLALRPGGRNEAPGLKAHLDYLRLEDIGPIIRAYRPRDDEGRYSLGFFNLHGNLADVRIDLPDADTLSTGFKLSADFKDLSTRARSGFPGFSGLAGKLVMDTAGGTVRFEDNSVRAHIPNLFEQALSADKVLGAISWLRVGNGWRVTTDGISVSNEDLALTLAGSTQWQDGEPDSPALSLVVHMTDGDLRKLPDYLPMRVLSEDAAQWLSRSLPAGRLTKGRLLFRGKVADFPFEHGNGSFEAHAHVSGTVLDYAQRWPSAEDLDADLHFKGKRLIVDVKSGRIVGTNILAARGEIPDLSADQPIFKGHGRFSGATRNSLRFLEESPLKEDFDLVLESLKATGQSELDLSMWIPLSGPRPARVKGRFELVDNQLTNPDLDTGLEHVNGTIEFTESTLQATAVRAELLNQPVTLALSRTEGAGNTTVSLQGSADAKLLGRYLTELGVPLGERDKRLLPQQIVGETEWQASLRVSDKTKHQATSAQFALRSSLRGLALKLPQPFRKDAASSLPLTIKATIDSAPRKRVSVSLGEIAKAELAFKGGAGDKTLDRAEIHFGAGGTKLPPVKGLTLSGVIPVLSWDDWVTFLDDGSNGEPGQQRLAILRQAKIRVDRLNVRGFEFKDAQLAVQRLDDNTLNVAVEAPNVAGKILVPASSDRAIVADLDRLYLDKPTSQRGGKLDPRAVGPINFACRDFSLGKTHVGVLKFSTTPQDDGLRVDTLFAGGSQFEARGSGNWSIANGRSTSRLSVEVTGNELGRVFGAFGFKGHSTAGGATELLVDSVWPGSPADFSLAEATGALHIKSTQGRILEIDPGAMGRVLGLLNLQSLPRRLKLDFDDMVKAGFEYDRIEGSFTLESGHAYTNDLVIDNPDATIEIAGRTGLIRKDYDQVVTVTPKVSSSTLPLVGALVGGPVGFGWGALAWVAEKVLDMDGVVDRVARAQYTVKGSWGDPIVEPLNLPADAMVAEDG